MPSALSALSGPPPAPPPPEKRVNALAGSPIVPVSAPAGAPPMATAPAPSHQQVVVALRHFDAIEQQLTAALQDPDVGRADLKSKIIDGMTTLVAHGIMSAGTAVQTLGSVPERPYDQKIWLQQHLRQTVQGEHAVMAHHQAAFAGQPVDAAPPSPDDHSNDVAGLLGHYRGAAGNG